MAAFPIGERFAVICADGGAGDAPHHVHRAAVVGRLRAPVHVHRPAPADDRAVEGAAAMSAAPQRPRRRAPRAPAARRSSATATTGRSRMLLGRLGRALPLPPVLIVGAGMAGLLALAAIEGDGASDAAVAAGVAWVVLLGGLSSGRPHTDRFAWAVPGFLRVGEYGGLVWIAANAGDSSHAGRLRADRGARLPPLRPGLPAALPGRRAAGLVELRRRRLGRAARARVGAAGGRRPARGHVRPRGRAGRRRSPSSARCPGRGSPSSPLSVYEDEEDEGQ